MLNTLYQLMIHFMNEFRHSNRAEQESKAKLERIAEIKRITTKMVAIKR